MSDVNWNKELFKAAQQGRTKDVQEALLNGADVDYVGGDNGYTPLIAAARDGYSRCIDVLVAAHADMSPRSKEGNTALMIAALNGKKECVISLISGGADVNELSAGERSKYAKEINEAQPLKIDSFSVVGTDTAIKYKGRILGLGKLRVMFNFTSKTVTEIINETPGPANGFESFRQNQKDILSAYNWMKDQGHDVDHPFKMTARRIHKNLKNQ